MSTFDERIYQPCREWIAERVNEKSSWEEIKRLCVHLDMFSEKLSDLVDCEAWPEGLSKERWVEYVDYYQKQIFPFELDNSAPVTGIDNGALANGYQVPFGVSSAWESYSKSLSLSDESVSEIKKSCIWIIRHLREDTRELGPVKGLVTGSVQSGKTANMEGLVSMAADFNWNFFIILSGTIDNLRKQTRDRFMDDLKMSEGVHWKVIDFAGVDKKYTAEELRLNSLQGSKSFPNRYVTVCLKNATRLRKLIDWLYEDPNRTGKLRIIIIDDEADQASINTAEITPEDEQERKVINQLIVNLANGKQSDGSNPQVPMQAINYISYTATPYANVLNEGSEESLYPKDFICTLEEAKEYFGPKVVFGNDEEGHPGFDIIRDISAVDEQILADLHKGLAFEIPDSLKDALAWFICCCAVLRTSGHKKPMSMLVHTTQLTKPHFAVYESISRWLSKTSKVMDHCKLVYEREGGLVTREDLLEANPDYPNAQSVLEYTYAFSEIRPEIELLISEITNISMDDDRQYVYGSGIHLCVDNTKANRPTEEGYYLRIVYPSREQLEEMDKAPAFIVLGGNTLSRGLTIEGLVCSYFSRKVNQADSLMQMARWFGYRKGYELLQRIWMTPTVQMKYRSLAKIDSDLKREVRLFMDRGISPSQFGPRIRNTPEIAKFTITAKNRMQSSEYGDFDFCGDSYETTDFDDGETLLGNMDLTRSFASTLVANGGPRASTVAKAAIWDGVDAGLVWDEFLARYTISPRSSLDKNLPLFHEWMNGENEEGRFTHWNVAFVNGDNKERLWNGVAGYPLGFVERTRVEKCKTHIDIKSLRSGRDAICDVDESTFSPEQAKLFAETKKSGKDIISRRSEFNLGDTPLLLIYLIKKDGGKPRRGRLALDACEDIVGISIIVPGDSIGNSHARSLRIVLPNAEVDHA